MREPLWCICCGTLTCEQKNAMNHNKTIADISAIKQRVEVTFTLSYLQCLHLTPNIMLLRHTWHIWESQDLVENLQKEEKKFLYHMNSP